MGGSIELKTPPRGRLAASCVGSANGDLHPPIVHVIEQEAEQAAGNTGSRHCVRNHTKIGRVCRLFVDHDGAAEGAVTQKAKSIFRRVERRVLAPCPLHHRCVVSSQKLHHVSEEPTWLGQDHEAVHLKRQFWRVNAPACRSP